MPKIAINNRDFLDGTTLCQNTRIHERLFKFLNTAPECCDCCSHIFGVGNVDSVRSGNKNETPDAGAHQDQTAHGLDHVVQVEGDLPALAREISSKLKRRENEEDAEGNPGEDGAVEAGRKVGVVGVPRDVDVPEDAAAKLVRDSPMFKNYS
jgi:hypothetical protein